MVNADDQRAVFILSRSTTMRKILLIIQQPTSETGRVGQILRERGYILDIRCPSLQDQLPATMDEHEGVVIFGGPMSANDSETFPFIRTELDWIGTALDSQKPFLGICLGAQLLARVLGSTVAPHPDGMAEIGYYPVVPTQARQTHFLNLMHFYHWNREGFELPVGAVLLASGDRFPNQAFRYGENAYGLQFHPEITSEMIDKWTTLGADQLNLPEVQSRAEQMQLHTRYASKIDNWVQGFLDDWLEAANSTVLSSNL